MSSARGGVVFFCVRVVIAAAIAAPACTQDFSQFEATGEGVSPSGSGGVGAGGATDGSVSMGGTVGSGGSSDTGGTAGTGASVATGGRSTGQDAGTGGNGKGGAGGTGGSVDAGTGGVSGTGGSVEAGSGGSIGTGGSVGTGGGGPDAGSLCDGQFGTVPGYVFCSETPTSCRFSFRTGTRSGATCGTLCSNRSSTCISVATRDFQATCTSTGTIGCTTARSSAICTCAK